MTTLADVPLIVISDNAVSERRITPAWSISILRTKLESITGVPPSSQALYLAPAATSGAAASATPSAQQISISAADEDATQLASFNLTPYAELHVVDTRPPSARLNLNDTSGVEKFVLPEEEYAAKTDSVLAWKKAQKLGRFDPNAEGNMRARVAAFAAEATARGIVVGKRCRVGSDDTRRGVVKYVGDVPETGAAGTWVGVELDEPVGGKNDGSINGTRYWGTDPAPGQAAADGGILKKGVFVRPERVEVGDEFGPLDGLEDMEEI